MTFKSSQVPVHLGVITLRPDAVVDETIDQIIDRSPFSRLQIIVVTLCALVTTIEGFDAQMIGFLASPIAATFHVDVRSFGPLFSIGLLGLMTGNLMMGPLGDRFGRRFGLVLSALAMGTFTLISGLTHELGTLTVLRFLTGLGIGGAMPNGISLIAEYSPSRLRPVTVCLSSACISVGSMSAGMCASFILPRWGWRPMFYLGGTLPLLFAVAILILMPESIRFLHLKGGHEEKVRRIMGRIAPAAAQVNKQFTLNPSLSTKSRFPVVALFRNGRAAVTPLLWTAYFMNLLVLYSVVSWMPSLLRAFGFTNATGVLAITLFGLGGIVGSLSQGWFLRRFRAHRVLIVEFTIFILFTLMLATVKLDLILVAAASFTIGWVINGAQSGLNVYSSTIYPTLVRSTGVGWGLGIGRIGSIVGPLLAGWALLAGWTSREIFAAGAVPAILAATAILTSASLGITGMSDALACSPTDREP